MRLRGLLVATAFALLGACATGSSGGSDDDGSPIDADHTGSPDARPGTVPDASVPPPDSSTGPVARTLTQSNSQTIHASPYTLNCNEFAATPTPVTATAENRFFRVFDLNALGISTTYTVTRFDFAIEDAQQVAGTLTVKIKFHSLSSVPSGNTFPLANLNQIYTQDVAITTPQTSALKQVTLTTPLVVAAGTRLVAEVFAPDMTALGNGNSFFLGSNGLGETGATYVQATACGLTDPTKMSTVVSPDPQVHWIMALQGTTP